VESHGDLKPRLVWEAWWLVPQAQRFKLQSHRHDPWLAVYQLRPSHPGLQLERSWEGRSGLLPEDLSRHPNPLSYLLGKSFHRHWELVVAEGEALWTMDTLGLSWHDPETLQGQHPPRQVQWRTGSLGLRRIPEEPEYQRLAQWRRNRVALDYGADSQTGQRVHLRKIYIAPELIVEFSNGARFPHRRLDFLRPSA
jgi:hypothetical protein